VNENDVTNLMYGQTYILTCVAKDSRPSVELNFYDNNRISLETFAGNTVRKTVNCTSELVCTTILSLSLTLNNEQSINIITCEAKNTTIPFDILIDAFFNVSLKGKPKKVYK
jgi:hypothetical protein